MRFGNAHVFNLYVDNSLIADGTNMAPPRLATPPSFVENSYYFEIADADFPRSPARVRPAGRAETGSTMDLVAAGIHDRS